MEKISLETTTAIVSVRPVRGERQELSPAIACPILQRKKMDIDFGKLITGCGVLNKDWVPWLETI